MKKKLTDNLGLKILAVLFSVAIWFIVVNISDPVDKTVFRNIPVEILNEDAVTSQGKVYEILDETNVIDVTVWAKRSILDTLGRENIIATADMQEINFMDTMVRIKLSTNKYNDKLDSIVSSTENMMIRVEDMKRKQFMITTRTVGEPADGYILGNVSVEQNLVRVSGPESLVDRMDHAEVSVDVAGLSQDIRTDVTIHLYDADNNPVEEDNLKKSLDQVKVGVEILQTKRVPLVFVTSGAPADGYALTGEIESKPSTVLVAGKGNAIKNIAQIEITDAALNVAGKNSSLATSVDVKKYLPENIILAESDFSGKVNVTVHIEKEITAEVPLNIDDIVISGVPEDMEGRIAEENDEIVLKVGGLAAAIEEMEETEIAASVDVAAYMEQHSLTELRAGGYQMQLTVALPEGISQEEEITLPIEITEKEAKNNGEE